MSEFESDEELARCVRQLLEMEDIDDNSASRATERPSHRETAATLPSFAAVSDVAPEELPPMPSSRTSVEPDAGRYSLITTRRPRA